MSAIIIASEAKKKAIRVLTKPAHLSMLYSRWPCIARELDVEEVNIKTLRDKIIVGTCYLPDAISAVIEDWVSRNGSKATLSILVSALEKLGLKYIAEALEDELGFGKMNVGGNVDNETVFNNTLPENIPYYIPRTLISRCSLDGEQLFQIAASVLDVFCFTGIQRYELTNYVQNVTTDNSSMQIQRQQLSTRFIVLDSDSHFPKICSKTNEPVHWIHFSNHVNDITKKYVKWIQSTGNIATIQRSIISNSKEQEKLTEARILQITKENKNPVCFSDCPGMGKSILLINIGHKIKEMCPERTIVYFDLRTFLSKVKALKSSSNRSRFQSVLCEALCKPGLDKVSKGKEELNETFASDTLKIELLLDGFDEIFPGDIPFCLEIIQDINAIKYTRIWIASRPHFLERFENALNVLGYNIHPFTEENQINFLSLYWLSQNQSLSAIKLTKLAEKSLKIIGDQTQDQDFAGIPLRCYLIAQVFEEAAIDFCAIELERQEIPELLAITSTFDLFTKMIEMKFRKYYSTYGITKYRQEALTRMLMKLAVELIFPEHLPIINSLLGSLDPSVSDLLNTGLLLRQGMDDFNGVKFVHQTVAEYFCAKFVFNLVGQEKEEWTEERLNFFFHQVLKLDSNVLSDLAGKSKHSLQFERYSQTRECVTLFYQATNTNKVKRVLGTEMVLSALHKFKKCLVPFAHPVICHFLNSFLYTNDCTSISGINSGCAMTSFKDIIWICVKNNFLGLFKLLTCEPLNYNRNEIFDCDFLFVLLHYCQLDFVKVGFAFFEKHEKLDLRLKRYILTHAAAIGNYSVFEYFCKEKIFNEVLLGEESKNILPSIIKSSIRDSERVVNQKIQIVRYILTVNSSIIETVNVNYIYPFHVDLLCCFIELKLVLNLGDQDESSKNTWLHLLKDFHTTNDQIYKLICLIPPEKFRRLVQFKNKDGENILNRWLHLSDVSLPILEKFKAANASFNSSDNYGNNLLIIAVAQGRSLEIIKYLLNEGANLNHVNLRGFSALFLWTNENRRDMTVLEELIKAGCDVFRQQDGLTFLHTLFTSQLPLSPDKFHAIVQILIENGRERLLETKSERKPYLTPLQLAVKDIKMHEETVTLLKSVETLNFENSNFDPDPDE